METKWLIEVDLSKETKGIRLSYSPEFSDYPYFMRLSMMNDKDVRSQK